MDVVFLDRWNQAGRNAANDIFMSIMLIDGAPHNYLHFFKNET